MNPLVLDHLLWSVCGPYNKPLTFQEIQTMTGLDSPAIADALRSPDVTPVWVESVIQTDSATLAFESGKELNRATVARSGGHIAYRPSDAAIRDAAWELFLPVKGADEAPSNVIRLEVAS